MEKKLMIQRKEQNTLKTATSFALDLRNQQDQIITKRYSKWSRKQDA